MKQIIIKTTLTILSSSLIIGCSSSSSVAPSQNSALNSISNSSAAKSKDYFMQKSMDEWFKNDWTPTVNADKEIQKKYLKVQTVDSTGKAEVKYIEADKATTTAKKGTKAEPTYIKMQKTDENGKVQVKYMEDTDRNFTLQEYVDKAAAYRRAHPNDYEHSHVKKLQSMPVIGN